MGRKKIEAWSDALHDTRVTNVEVLPNRRPLNEAKVEELMRSIQEVGLLHPPTIRVLDSMMLPRDDGEEGLQEVLQVPVLVSGRHRLEALKRLGFDWVQMRVIKADDLEAELAEIAENLHRAELTALQRDEQIARWIELTEQKQAGKLPQPVSVSKGGRGKTSGTRAAAKEIGIDREDARRATKVASLSDEAKQVARDLHLDDNRTALLQAAKAEAGPDQVSALKSIAEEKRKPKARAAPPPATDEPGLPAGVPSREETARNVKVIEAFTGTDIESASSDEGLDAAGLKAQNKKLRARLKALNKTIVELEGEISQEKERHGETRRKLELAQGKITGAKLHDIVRVLCTAPNAVEIISRAIWGLTEDDHELLLQKVDSLKTTA